MMLLFKSYQMGYNHIYNFLENSTRYKHDACAVAVCGTIQ